MFVVSRFVMCVSSVGFPCVCRQQVFHVFVDIRFAMCLSSVCLPFVCRQ